MNSESKQPAAITPAPIMALSTAFWDAQVLLTANRMGLFQALAEGPRGLNALCAELTAEPRALRLLLNACIALGLLEEHESGYANAPMAAAFLVAGRPGYLGNAIRYSDNLYATWGRLEQAVHSGAPQMPSADYLGGDEKITRDFVYGMHDRALGVGRVLVELVSLDGRRRLLDVGGGPGTYASLFAARYPGLEAVVLDLPGVVAHAQDIIASLGAAGRVQTLAGSFHEIPFPGGNDAVLISGVFHRESEAGCRKLIARAADALEPGGLLIVSDVFADAGGASPTFATLFGLNMLLTAPDGGVHADADVADWMRAAGFDQVQTAAFPPPMPHRVVTGRKT
ncbi:MAG: methyltransferase [Pseudomonadales bacterium]